MPEREHLLSFGSHERSQAAYACVGVRLEIVIKLSCITELQQVVVEGLLAHAHDGCRLLQRVLLPVVSAVRPLEKDAVVQHSPLNHDVDDLSDSALAFS